MRYKEEYFYSLKEFIDLFYADGNTPFTKDDEFDLSTIIQNLWDTQPPVELITGIPQSEFVGNSNLEAYGLLDRLFRYILNRYQYEYIGFGEIENPTKAQLCANETIKKFFRVMIGIMVQTYPKYKTMLTLYDNEKNNLMNAVKSYTKFDDTPQTPDSYGSSEFLTTFTEYGNEYASKIARINEIERLYNNLMMEWTNLFERIFIEV